MGNQNSGPKRTKLAQLDNSTFTEAYDKLGPTQLAKLLGVNKNTIDARAHRLRTIDPNISITKELLKDHVPSERAHPGRLEYEITNGIVIVASDAHFWPGPISTAHRALVKFCKEMKPKIIIMNGDVVDMASISRHPPIGWANLPTVQEEIETAQDRMQEIAEASGKAIKCWPIGNHDSRFSTRLATVAPQYAKVHGTSLKDFFPLWDPCWAAWINSGGEPVVIKHRWKGGVGATRANTLNSGYTMITGHLHSQKCTPYNDYRPHTRYGVDTGCLADPNHHAFLDYTEDSPKDWRSGFCVLTFKNSKLLMPELVAVWDARTVQFRGELIKV